MLKRTFPNLIFTNNFHDEKIGERVTISARSCNRIDLANPLKKIQKIFVPKKL